MDIPDFDPAFQAEQYYEALERNSTHCDWCGEVINGDGYIWDGDCICDRCCLNAILDNFSVSDIAKALGVGVATI